MRQLDSTQGRIGTGRLSLALLIVLAVYFSLFRASLSPGWIVVSVAAFVGLVVYDGKVRRLSRRARRGVDFYRNGLARLEDRWIGRGQQGERFADPHHVYSADLDLFGAGGLFELLCIARTRMGEETLANWLLRPASVNDVKARHAAVAELRGRFDFREKMALFGESPIGSTAGVNPNELLAWVNAADRLQQSWIKWLARGLALAFVATAAVWYATRLLSPLLSVLVIEVGLLVFLKRQLQQTMGAIETTFANLDLLADLLACIENEKQAFRAPLLSELANSLGDRAAVASEAIEKLRATVQLIESRRNAFMAIIDVPFMISLQAAIAAEKWRRVHREAVKSWLELVGQVEALLSLAAYSYEHPDDVFPQLAGASVAFHGQNLAHPLLSKARAVSNNVQVDAESGVLLVSGSNMSGKSTLLRTVGVNVVLAMAGAPVRATSLRMTPLQIGASIRVNDSLHEGSSRFYAEITRLKQIFELSGKDPPLLALVDELLQGTNSADRRAGARGVLGALLHRGAIVIASTHDLALASLGAEEDIRITNVHFQDHIEHGRMKFDYALKPGTVTKSNALELMRAIGLEV